MHRTTAYVGHFLTRFERNVKLYMACAALIGFSAFGIYDERDINLLASYEIAPKSRVYMAYNLGDTAAERAGKLRFKVAYLLSY